MLVIACPSQLQLSELSIAACVDKPAYSASLDPVPTLRVDRVTLVPGSMRANVVPLKSAATLVGDTVVGTNWRELKLPTNPVSAVSMTSRATCGPAASATVLLTVVYVCKPPVLGMANGAVTLT